MQNKQSKIESLASQILLHKKLYYSGNAVIPDSAFDALEDELKVLAPDHPVLSMVGYAFEDAQKKVPHDPPMLSLAKTYDLEELRNFLAKNSCVQIDKFDGMAIALEYDANGVLARASTRGSGKVGEDVTEHAYHLAALPKRLKLPTGSFDSFEVRGEVFFPISAFEPFREHFDSYRNAVPGTFGRKDVEQAAPVLRVLRFCAYDVLLKKESSVVPYGEVNNRLNIGEPSYLKRLAFLETLGFFTGVQEGAAHLVAAVGVSESDIKSAFEKKRDYQIDGLVFRVNDDSVWESMGITSHHPRGSLAYKQEGEVAVTKIVDIEENVGRSGKITFRAHLEPVYLSGAKITYATLHNAEFIESGKYAPGAYVRLTRSGEVIPSIVGLERESEKKYTLPTTCPCGYPVKRQGPDLVCGEKKHCARKDQESLVHFVSTLGIFGISDKIVMRLREAGLIQEAADIFRLKKEDLMELEGFGEKSAENAVRAIAEKKEVPLAIFLAALGLKRGGIVKCQEVARRFVTLERVLTATADDLREERGWAEKSADDFIESLNERRETIEHLLRYMTVVDDTSKKSVEGNRSHPYFGKIFCITGALSRPRDEYKKILESLGAKVTGSVSDKTDFLVCNEESGSKKYIQAKSLGVPIISEETLSSHLNLR